MTYPGIRRLIFNTRYNNETTIFERNAPQGVLFGGGKQADFNSEYNQSTLKKYYVQ